MNGFPVALSWTGSCTMLESPVYPTLFHSLGKEGREEIDSCYLQKD